MLGIENLKNTALFLINLGEGLENKLEDGKLSIFEALQLAGKSSKEAIEVFRSGKEIAAEFKDLDDKERGELIELVKSELDLEKDNIEKTIEKGIILLDALADFIESF